MAISAIAKLAGFDVMPFSKTSVKTKNFEINPIVGGTPAMFRQPIMKTVAETGILPRLNTGIAHKEPGIGMVGAGVLRAPLRCFAEAYETFRDTCC